MISSMLENLLPFGLQLHIPSIQKTVKETQDKLKPLDGDEKGNDPLVRFPWGDILEPSGNHVYHNASAVVEGLPDTEDEAQLNLAWHHERNAGQEGQGVHRSRNGGDNYGPKSVGLREPDEGKYQDPNRRRNAYKHHPVAEEIEEGAHHGRAHHGDHLLHGRGVAGDLLRRVAGDGDDVGAERVPCAYDAGLQDLRAHDQPEEARNAYEDAPVGDRAGPMGARPRVLRGDVAALASSLGRCGGLLLSFYGEGSSRGHASPRGEPPGPPYVEDIL